MTKPAKQMNVRLDPIHQDLLEKMVEKLIADGVNTNKTDVIQKALYVFARENVLGKKVVSETIDKHYEL